jgi:hypothetical protein
MSVRKNIYAGQFLPWTVSPATAAVDSFGRPRSSAPKTFFNSDFEYDLNPLWFVASIAGTGVVAKTAGESSATLSTGGTANGAGAVYQTKQYFRYEPGKGRFCIFSALIGSQTSNVRSRMGNFDANNGVFFEMDGAVGMSVNQRSNISGSPVDTKFAQANWNIDRFDGSGPSGVVLDFSNTQLFWIDFQWMGTGHTRFGFFVNGSMTACHEVYNDNVITSPYTNTASLPLRMEIFNTGAAASASTMKWICCSLVNEGSPEIAPSFIRYTASNSTVPKVVGNLPVPILSVQPMVSFAGQPNRIHNLLDALGVACTGGNSAFYQLIYNGSLTGANFSAVDTNSGVAFDVSATGISGGTVVASGYAASGAQMLSESLSGVILPFTLDYSGTVPDTYSIVCASLPATGPLQPAYTSVVIPKPAAGNVNYTATVPAGVQWKVKSAYFILTTGTTAASRQTWVYATDAGGNRLGQIYMDAAQPASVSWSYSMGTGGGYFGPVNQTLGFIEGGIPEWVLGPGMSLTVGGFGIQPTDQFSNLVVNIEASAVSTANCVGKLSWIELR